MIIESDQQLYENGRYYWTPQRAVAAWSQCLQQLTPALASGKYRLLMMLIGIPGSGKSTYASANDRPDMIIFDGTFVDATRRSRVTAAARAAGVPVIAVWLVLPTHGGRFNGLGFLPGWTAVPLCLAIGALIGALNGLLVLKVRLNAFIVTLGMLITLRGLQIAITGGQSVFELPSSIKYLGRAAWLGVPVSVWICVVLFAVGIVALSWFRHGRSLYAIGGNADAARAAGIRVERVVWVVFIVGSILAALAGILFVGRLGSIAAGQGAGMIFRVFAAAVIGGISLNGGRGTLFGALTGVLVLVLIDNVMVYGGVPPVWEQFLDGVIILGALVVSRFTSGEAQD